MARTVAFLPGGIRIAGYISLGVIAKFFPAGKVREALAQTNRAIVPLLFPPRQRTALHEAILDEILQECVVRSRNRVNLRAVKRKMNNYSL